MFIETRWTTLLEFRPNGIFIADALQKHIVPTKSTPNTRVVFVGTKEDEVALML